jgi:hypothetical protein
MASTIVPRGADHAAVLHGLVRKRAELAGGLEKQQAQVRQLQNAVAHIDAVLMLFNPDLRVDQIRPKRTAPPHAAGYGEITNVVIDCLREADVPLSSRALAQSVIDARGLDERDAALEVLMAKRVRACLRVHRVAGRVRAVPMVDAPQGWVLVGGRADRLLAELGSPEADASSQVLALSLRSANA